MTSFKNGKKRLIQVRPLNIINVAIKPLRLGHDPELLFELSIGKAAQTKIGKSRTWCTGEQFLASERHMAKALTYISTM